MYYTVKVKFDMTLVELHIARALILHYGRPRGGDLAVKSKIRLPRSQAVTMQQRQDTAAESGKQLLSLRPKG